MSDKKYIMYREYDGSYGIFYEGNLTIYVAKVATEIEAKRIVNAVNERNELLQDVERLKSLNNKYFDVITALVGLKKYKEKYGKTDAYMAEKEVIWNLAKKIIE